MQPNVVKNISILHKGKEKKVWDYLVQIQRQSNCIISGFARVKMGWQKHLYMVQFAGDPVAINKLIVLLGGQPNVPQAQPQVGQVGVAVNEEAVAPVKRPSAKAKKAKK